MKKIERKSFLIVGMGSFGRTLAAKLLELDNDVMVVDRDQASIDELGEIFEDAYCADLTKEAAVAKLGVEKFDVCFIASGSDFKASLEIASHLKDHGARYVVAKTASEIQSRLLKKIGVDELVYPEKDVAETLAIMKNADNVHDLIALNDVYALYSVSIPSGWVGKTIVELDIRKKCNINVVAIQNSKNELILRAASRKLEEGDKIKILGRQDEIDIISETIKNL